MTHDSEGIGSKTMSDYARLFHEIFPRTTLQQNMSSSPGGVSAPADEQAWLRSIMKDPNDRSWDCDIVHETGKPLVVQFDP